MSEDAPKFKSVAQEIFARDAAKRNPPPAPELEAIKRGASWRLADHANNAWRAFVGESVTIEDLEKEGLWAAVAGDLNPYDRIAVVSESRKFWADCLCIDASHGRARVVVLNSLQPIPPGLGSNARRIPDGYDIRRNDLTGKWLAFRVQGDIVMNGDGGNSEEEALRTLLDHAVFRGGS